MIHLGHLRGTGPWKVKGFSLMSLFLISFTPTPEAPVHQRNIHHRNKKNLLLRIRDVEDEQTQDRNVFFLRI